MIEALRKLRARRELVSSGSARARVIEQEIAALVREWRKNGGKLHIVAVD